MQRSIVIMTAVFCAAVVLACTIVNPSDDSSVDIGIGESQSSIPVSDRLDEESLMRSSEASARSDDSLLDVKDLVTRNVTFTGVVEEGGLAMIDEGAYRLSLADGRIVLLEAGEGIVVPFDLYQEKFVRVRGDVRPADNGAGTLMMVREIVWLRRETLADGSEREMERKLCDDERASCPNGALCMMEGETGICFEDGSFGIVSSSSVSSSSSESSAVNASSSSFLEENIPVACPAGYLCAQVSCDPPQKSSCLRTLECASCCTCYSGDLPLSAGTSSSESGVSSASTTSASSSSLSSEESAYQGEGADLSSLSQEKQLLIERMAAEDYAPERWTQVHCSTHVGVCMDAHKNWWYKSFGSTASVLWHFELGAAPVEIFGDGPIDVDLKTGSLESLGIRDNDVRIIGSRVIGYRSWTENRHFEISALSQLYEPVKIVTRRLRPADEQGLE